MFACAGMSAATACASVSDRWKALHTPIVGAGPTIIFVHGWTCDSRVWVDQLSGLAGRFRVAALDLPGHGESPYPSSAPLTMELFVEAVEITRRRTGAVQPVLVGHSMGAAIVRSYAERYPQHVKALIAVDGYLDPAGIRSLPTEPPHYGGLNGRERRTRDIERMFSADTPGAVRERVRSIMLAASERAAVDGMNVLWHWLSRRPNTSGAPMMAMYGTGADPDEARILERAPRYEGRRFNSGHFLMMEKPDMFNEVLEEFLARLL